MIQTLLFFVLGFFILAAPVSAVSVTISNTPSSITDQPFTFNVSLSCSGCSPSYLRANLFPTGTDKYFGYTYNGSSFVNSSTCSDYLPLPVDSSGNWNGTIQAQIDTSSNYYSGPGNYSLKVRRYTGSCSTFYWSNEMILAVNIPTPTPSPTPAPTTSPTSSPSTSSFTISNTPSQINSDQSFSVPVNLSLPNNPSTNFYLKGAFKTIDGSNYFGLTKISGAWIKNGSSYSNQYQITTDSSGNWSGNLEVQPDSGDSGFTGTGDYIFKVGRYTSTGSGPTWSNDQTIKINSTENNNQSETSTDSPSTTLPSPTNTTPVSSTKTSSKLTYQIASVASAQTTATESATPSATEIKSQKQINFSLIIGIVLIVSGIGLTSYIYLQSHETIFNKFRKRN